MHRLRGGTHEGKEGEPRRIPEAMKVRHRHGGAALGHGTQEMLRCRFMYRTSQRLMSDARPAEAG